MPEIIKFRSSMRVSLHPAAIAAYTWLQEYSCLIDLDRLPKPLLSQLMSQPIFGVMTSITKTERAFSLFSPLMQSRLWEKQTPPEGALLIYYSKDELAEQQIETAAWISALTPLCFSIDAKRLAGLRDSLLRHMPAHQHQALLGENRISDSTLCRWTKRRRSTLIQQRAKNRPETPDNTPNPDIFAQLSQGWAPHHE